MEDVNSRVTIRMVHLYNGDIPKEKEWILRLSNLVKKIDGNFSFHPYDNKKELEKMGIFKDCDMARYKYVELLENKYLHS